MNYERQIQIQKQVRSGGLSFKEVADVKTKEFQKADTDGDGRLSENEVIDFQVGQRLGRYIGSLYSVQPAPR